MVRSHRRQISPPWVCQKMPDRAGIHPTAIISASAKIAKDVSVGPYAYIGEGVQLETGVSVGHGATVEGPTLVGADTQIWPQAAVGMAPQDLKYDGEETRLEIGARCRIREFASLHRGTAGGGGLTKIGDDVLIMNGAHVGHDCQVGNKCIIAANSALGGHVIMGEQSILGGVSGIHQFVRIGAHAMLAAGIVVTQDVPTYAIVMGGEENLAGVNITGLKRRGFSRESIQNISKAMKLLFLEETATPLAERLIQAQTQFGHDASVQALLEFVEGAGSNDRQRGFVSAR